MKRDPHRPAQEQGNAAAATARTDPSSANATGASPAAAAPRKPTWSSAARSLVIIWYLPPDPNTRYTGLGADFYTSRTDPDRRRRNHVRQIEALG